MNLCLSCIHVDLVVTTWNLTTLCINILKLVWKYWQFYTFILTTRYSLYGAMNKTNKLVFKTLLLKHDSFYGFWLHTLRNFYKKNLTYNAWNVRIIKHKQTFSTTVYKKEFLTKPIEICYPIKKNSYVIHFHFQTFYTLRYI